MYGCTVRTQLDHLNINCSCTCIAVAKIICSDMSEHRCTSFSCWHCAPQHLRQYVLVRLTYPALHCCRSTSSWKSALQHLDILHGSLVMPSLRECRWMAIKR
jgi:hypothetical protein